MAKHELVTQSSAAPTRKVTAAGIGGLLATIVLSLADYANVVDLPTFWDTLISAGAAFAAGYLNKDRSTEV